MLLCDEVAPPTAMLGKTEPNRMTRDKITAVLAFEKNTVSWQMDAGHMRTQPT